MSNPPVDWTAGHHTSFNKLPLGGNDAPNLHVPLRLGQLSTEAPGGKSVFREQKSRRLCGCRAEKMNKHIDEGHPPKRPLMRVAGHLDRFYVDPSR